MTDKIKHIVILIFFMAASTNSLYAESSTAVDQDVEAKYYALMDNLRSFEHGEPSEISAQIISLGDKVVPLLVMELSNRDFVFRRIFAARLLGMLGNQTAVNALIGSVKQDRWVRDEAVKALGRLKNPKATKVLHRAYRRGNIHTKLLCIWAMGQIGSQKSFGLLQNITYDQDKKLSAAAIISLLRVRDRGDESSIIKMSGASDPYTRLFAARALGEIATSKSKVALGDMLGDANQEVVTAVLEAIAESENYPAAHKLVTMLGHDNPVIKIKARESLFKLTGKNFGYSKQKWNDYLNANLEMLISKQKAAEKSSVAPEPPASEKVKHNLKWYKKYKRTRTSGKSKWYQKHKKKAPEKLKSGTFIKKYSK